MDNRNVNINTIYPVYLSLTTIPERMSNTLLIVKGILKHVKGFERLIINIPYKYNRWPDSSFDVYSFNEINDKRLIINRCSDLGPITKIVPTLRLLPKECNLVIFDDECYHYEAIKIASRESR